jgi:hypothetical protein
MLSATAMPVDSGERYLWGLELKYVEETPPIAQIC